MKEKKNRNSCGWGETYQIPTKALHNTGLNLQPNGKGAGAGERKPKQQKKGTEATSTEQNSSSDWADPTNGLSALGGNKGKRKNMKLISCRALPAIGAGNEVGLRGWGVNLKQHNQSEI